ncbi:MAG: FapA family protein [bacterium]|nr:FapA family protein [bacterium]
MDKKSWDLDGYFKIITSNQGVFLTIYSPVGEGEKVNIDDVLIHVKERGLTDVNLDLIEQVVEESSGLPIKIGKAQEEKKTGVLIVEIMEDEMSAYLTIVPPPSGSSFKLTPEEIKDVLKKEGVSCGYDEEVLIDISIEPRKELNRAILVAKGIASVKGKDAIIDYKFDTHKDKVRFKENENGRVNYRELNLIENVQEGQVLAIKMLPTAGKSGITVTGKELPAEEGKDLPLPIGKNTYASDDGLELYASCTGRVVWSETKIDVESAYEIKGDVGYDTGNIEFAGTVIVGGNVKDGFSIKAGGDIEIRGCVEKAVLEAAGNVRIQNGVIGKGEGIVKAGRDVYAKFIENATVIAGEDVIVSEAIMHSNVDTGKRAIVYGGKKGVILGGRIRAKDEINARTIGSWAEVETSIEAGIDPHTREDISILEKEIEEDKKSFNELKLGIKNLVKQKEKSGNRLSPDKEELLAQHLRAQNLLMTKLRDTAERMITLQKEFSAETGGKICVFNVIYPGVKICIRNTTLFIKKEYKYTMFIVKANQIKLLSYEEPKMTKKKEGEK